MYTLIEKTEITENEMHQRLSLQTCRYGAKYKFCLTVITSEIILFRAYLSVPSMCIELRKI